MVDIAYISEDFTKRVLKKRFKLTNKKTLNTELLIRELLIATLKDMSKSGKITINMDHIQLYENTGGFGRKNA